MREDHNMNYQWWNNYNLGDCFWHCLFMRKLAIRQPDDNFTLHCKLDHMSQLYDVITDLPNIHLRAWTPGTPPPDGARPAWIGPYHQRHPLRNDIIAFLIEWFAHLAACDGLESPIKHRRDLLCDYPELYDFARVIVSQRDWLVINSQPQSGQFAHDHNAMNALVGEMLAKGHSVTTTADTGLPGARWTGSSRYANRTGPMTVTQIGGLSCWVGNILAVATGPIWPTFNVWNQRQHGHRIILINEIHLDYGDRLPHFGSVDAAKQYLVEQGVL